MSLSHSLSFSFSLFALSATTLIGATARGISNVSYIHIGKKKSETGKRVLISSGVRGLRSFSAFSFVENCVEAGHSWGKSTKKVTWLRK